MFCGISGPSFSGKTTLARLLSQSIPGSILIPDYHEHVWESLLDSGVFTIFQEITKDRDYLLLYTRRVIDYYRSVLEEYADSDEVVILDGTHIDLLIYSMLQLWYHYPTRGLQEEMIHDLLKVKDVPDIIYMTVSDDESYPLKRRDYRRYNTSFLKCRKTELYYYDIFRDLQNVVTLPSSVVLGCDEFIVNDLKERGFLH